MIKMLIFLMILCPPCAYASTETLVNVTIGKVSQVSFPLNIAKVIKGGSADSILVEALDRDLYIMPKSDSPANIFVTDVAGASYALNLQIAKVHDVSVLINQDKIRSRSNYAVNNMMLIMKEMLLGHELVGADQIKLNYVIQLKNSPISLEFLYAYEYPSLTAYIIQAKNLANKMTVVPVEHLSLGRVLGIASDTDTLMPKGQEGDHTNIYMIKAKSYGNVLK